MTYSDHRCDPNYHKVDWTENNTQILRDNYGTLSSRQIALLIPNATRSAVIGKAHRLELDTNLIGGGWGLRDKTKSPKPPVVPGRNRKRSSTVPGQHPRNTVLVRDQNAKAYFYKQVEIKEQMIDIDDLKCEPVSFTDRETDQCSWPLDSGMCCGLARAAPYVNKHGRRVVSSYCRTHQHASVNQEVKYRKHFDNNQTGDS